MKNGSAIVFSEALFKSILHLRFFWGLLFGIFQ